MADFQAGEAWVELKPSAKGFSREAKRALAAIDLDKSVDLDADATKIKAAIKEVKAQLASLNREKASPSIDFDKSVVEAKIAEVKAKLEELSAKTATPKVDVDTALAKRELNNLERQLTEINQRRANIDVDADITKASTALRELESKLSELNGRKGEVKVTADTTVAKQRLTELDQKLAELSRQKATPEVELKIAQAQQEALRIRAELDRLGAMRPSAQVDADIASASAKLAVINRQLSQIDGKRVSANVDASSSGRASLILMGVVAALGAIGAAAPAAVAALAAVGGAAGALGQGIGAAIMGFSGIGDALKALEQDEKSAATSSAASSNTRASAAKQVASAQRSLESAQIQSDRAAITGAQQVAQAQQAVGQARQSQARTAVSGAQQVADAERSLAQAVQSAARTQITSAQQVAAARRAVSDAMVAANARVASAERSLESANRSRQYAQEALTRATQDAVRANRDLQMSVAGGALATERATLSLQQARQRLAQSTSSDPLELADLSLSVREAEQNLKETQVRYGDLTQEQAKWARTGVEGSDQVVAAQRALQDSQRGVGDAQRGLTEAQVSGARQVADAQDGLAKAQQQASWAMQDAQRGVADAQRAVGRAAADAAQANSDAAQQVAQAQQGVARAVQQASWQQQDAARAVADAQRQLAEAYAAGADTAAGSAKKAAYALAQLTPAGRSMVDFLKNEWQPTWQKTTDAVATAMLPKVETAMRNLLALEPVFTAGMAETGSVIGDLAIKGSELAASAPFQSSFASIMASNNRALYSYGDAGIHLFGAITDLYAAAGPLIERFARMADNSAQAFESWVIGARASGELQTYLDRAGDALEYVGGWIVDVGVDLVQFAVSLAPLGVAVLEIVRGITDWVSWLAQLNPGLTSVAVGTGLAAVGAAKLGTAMKGMALAQGVGGLTGFANVAKNLFNPQALAASGALTSLRGGFDRAGAAAGGAVIGMTGSATAGGRVAGVMSAAGRGVSGFASALPLAAGAAIALTAVVDAQTTSTAELADAMMKGGSAAAEVNAKVEENRSTGNNWLADVDNWIKSQMGLATSVEEVKAEVDRQRAGMSDLQRAQSLATEAQGNYETAVRQFGQNSPQAVAAQDQLAGATTKVKDEQEKARTATMNATQALEDQQNKILGSLNARLALKQSLQSTKDAQKAYNDAVAQSGPKSDEAGAALIRLEQSQTAQADAAMRAAAEEGKKKGVTDTSKLSNDAYAQSIKDMVAASDGELTPTLQEMVRGLDASGLSAAGATVKIDETGRAVATFPNGKTVTLDAATSPQFFQTLQQAKDLVNGTKGTIGVDADTGPGVSKVGNFKLTTDATTGVVTIDGDINPADQDRLGIKAKTDGTTGTMWIDGNEVPCNGKLNGMRVTVDKTTGVMTIDGDKRPADQRVNEAQAHARQPQTFGVGADTRNADTGIKSWWQSVLDWFTRKPIVPVAPGANVLGRGAVNQGRADGGLITGFAAGGSIQHKQVLRGYSSGAGGSKKIAKSDTVPAMLTPGEFVIRKRAVDAVGVPALEAINGMATGGPVGFAGGGNAKKRPDNSDVAASTPAASVDSTSASAAAGSTAALASQMSSAVSTAGALVPALAAVTAGQQRMATTGVAPLVGALQGSLFPALSQYGIQLGATVPQANTALLVAQTATQASTTATAANITANSSVMAASTTGMSVQAQAQHAALRAGQVATQVSTTQTAANTAANTANMAATTTGMSVQAQAQHANLRSGQVATQVSTTQTAANTATNSAGMIGSTTNMSVVSQGQHTALRASQGQTVVANNALAQNTQIQTANMSGATIGMSGTVQNHLGQVRGAQGVTSQSTTAFANSWQAQMARTQPDSGNPIRWVINYPMKSITEAWNNLDGQFALGKHVNPYIPNFASGGKISGPGNGTSDSIMARVSDGEFVVRESIASRVPHFLNALNGGQTEAIQAAGGRGAKMPGYAAGGVIAAQEFAKSQNGKPYQWAGTGNPSWDCSGFMSGVTKALRGQNPFSGRLGTTSSMPWGGFIPGLRGAFTIGNSKRQGHMAGTLSGVNIESGGSHGVHYGAPAIGADNGMFEEKWTLPEVGGVFASGGAGGGGFDPTPAINAAFAKVYREIADVPKFFGGSPQVGRDQGVAKFSADKVKAKATEQLMAMFAGGGMFGPAGDGAPFIVKQISDAARAFGFGVDGATIGTATGLVESNLRNLPGGDRDSVGVFQQRPSMGWGTVQECMNVLHAAGSFFKRFPANWRSMVPGDVAQSVQRSAFPGKYQQRMGQARGLVAAHGGAFDNGGLLPPDGVTVAQNNTRYPERVLNNVETRSYDTLTQLIGKNGSKLNLTAYEPQQSRPATEITNNYYTESSVSQADATVRVQRRQAALGLFAGGVPT